MPSFHAIRTSDVVLQAVTVLGLAVPFAASAQPPPPSPPIAGSSSFTIFLRGPPIGSDQIAFTRTASGWSIVSSGRVGAPIDALARRVEVRYTPDWRPIDMSLDATIRGQVHTLRTIVDGTAAKTDMVINAQATLKTDTIDPAAVLILPNSFFAPFEALAVRVRGA